VQRCSKDLKESHANQLALGKPVAAFSETIEKNFQWFPYAYMQFAGTAQPTSPPSGTLPKLYLLED